MDLAGQVLSDDQFGRFVVPNLTSGEGGVTGEYSDADWVRAIRHGVDPDGRPLVIMPAQFFHNLSDADLGEIITYVKSVPPVDKESPDLTISPLGRAFIAAGLLPDPIPAEIIDHTAERPPEPVPGVTAEYGKYMTFVCTVCHLEDFSGGPDAGQGMNLTPGGRLGEWTEAEFINTIRTGVAPDGEELDPDEMPWRDIRRLSDDQLRAIWLYLQSLPPVVTEHR